MDEVNVGVVLVLVAAIGVPIGAAIWDKLTYYERMRIKVAHLPPRRHFWFPYAPIDGSGLPTGWGATVFGVDASGFAGGDGGGPGCGYAGHGCGDGGGHGGSH
ncbi:MAG TPA: hypothetical protein VKS60_14440 [Stellaceae bacterium]|nr:hypothetical protein [Stellaceae bacterium]